jgi:mono/diheme cytochrome c family protein
MKRVLKWLGMVVAVLLALAGVAYAWVSATWNADYSAMPRPAIVASTDPAVIAHGEYIFNAVAHCSICHGPKTPRPTRGDRLPMAGGLTFRAGPFGTFIARNLTSDRETGLGAQSDADLARAIRSAVDHQGRFLPFMKLGVGPIADQDLTALISYMRTFPPVRREEEPEVWGLAGKYLAATKLKPAAQVPPPYVAAAPEPSAARGAYLANGPAACRFCHTKHDTMAGFVETSVPFSGGDVQSDSTDPTSEIQAPNLTPDPGSSPIAGWDEATFLARFRGGKVFPGSGMPWEHFAEMTDADVRSLYRYFRSLPPVRGVAGPSRRPAGWKPADL